MIYDRGSFALRTVPSFQVLVWRSSIRTGSSRWSGRGLGVLSGCNSDHSGPAASSTAP